MGIRNVRDDSDELGVTTERGGLIFQHSPSNRPQAPTTSLKLLQVPTSLQNASPLRSVAPSSMYQLSYRPLGNK